MKAPLEEEELKTLAARGGMTVKDLLNPKSTGFKSLGLDLGQLSDSDAARYIKEQPKIMRRPLLSDGKKLAVGFKAEDYAAVTGR